MLFAILKDHQQDLSITKRIFLALRRLVQSGRSNMASLVRSGGLNEGEMNSAGATEGFLLLLRSFNKNFYDDTICREACALINLLGATESAEDAQLVVSESSETLLKAIKLHHHS